MRRLTRDGTAEPVSRDQILRHVRGQGNIRFTCSAGHVHDWQPYPQLDPLFCGTVRTFSICLIFIPSPALLQKNKQAADWLGVWVCLMLIYNCVGVRKSRRYDLTTFLAR